MQRLSSPIQQLKDHYDVVVVGSGYGGGISASRMARAGRSVCLFERGTERLPGEYPDTESEALANMQMNTPDGHVGSRTGLFDFHVNSYMNALVGCGLGGTSLINANVSLQADSGVFLDERWPAPLRGDGLAVLKPFYELAKTMLQPTPFPQDRTPVAKFAAHQKSAEAMGLGDRFYAPPINVHFEDATNAAGVEQKACTLCGDCVSGCNHYAKNTTLMNYLPDAWNHGAEIYTEVSVRHVERGDGDQWIVHFQPVDEGRQKFDAPEMFVTCDIVILAAGTLGSSEIMLRSKQKGLSVSDVLGQRFSGNGDVLGFGFDCDEHINGIGFGHRPPGEVPNAGPCITSIIDLRDAAHSPAGYVIEEGSIPGAIGGLLPAAMSIAADLIGQDTDTGVIDRLREKGRVEESWLRGPYHGAVQNTQTYLIMSHDGANGVLKLVDDRIRIDWPQVGDETVFARDNETLFNATKALGGTFVKNPIWSKELKDSLTTVHPLGGCCMGDDVAGGAVNHKGQVYSGKSGTDVHTGLYIADGAIVPMSLAVNPLFTISALAERINAIIAEERGWKIDYTTVKPMKSGDAAPQTPGITFTETMKGFLSTVALNDYQAAYDEAKAAASAMEFTLTISSTNLDDMLSNPAHQATLVGTVACRALSAEPMTVSSGIFNLFVKNSSDVDTRNMVYRMVLRSESGKPYYFQGFKTVSDAFVLQVWHQTTTLYVTVHDGTDDKGAVVGKGILHIEPLDFAKQMTTMSVTNAPSITEKLKGLAKFGTFFAGTLWDAYGGVLVPNEFFNPEAPPRKKRQLRVDPPEVHTFQTSDGKVLRLTRYRGGQKGPLLMVHGAGVSSEIFSTDLIDTNMLEYLFTHGYDCWLFDFRVSTALPAAREQSTGDLCASIDHPEAVRYILQATGSTSLQAMVHCYGSTTFFMSLLAGLKGVRSMVCSQIAADIIVPTLTSIKAGLHLPSVLDALGIKSLSAYADSQEGILSRLYDAALKFNPVPADEGCHSPVCHRISFMYGLLYEHQQLSQRFHENLQDLFAELNISTFEHLALMARKGHLVSMQGADLYMPHFDRLKFPIRFIHGEKNRCYLPDSTQVTYDKLVALNGQDYYSRRVIPGYGHIDCVFGKNAVTDVYPLILEHLEKTNS